jgi:DNA-binding MarR family transcriptional regulator
VGTRAAQERLSERELGAWRSFLRAHAQITRKLEADLVAEHDLPLPSYDVLLQLAETPGRRLRMTELADRVLLSRSGLTRLVDRLEREGLVERTACPNDARGTNAVLTDAGLERLRTAAPTHLQGVSEHVTSRLTAVEVDQLKALMLKLTDGPHEPPAGGCGAAEGVH